jgi:hypothetical protein
MKQYFLTIDCEVIEYTMKFTTNQSLSQFDDYRVIWKKGEEKYKNDTASSFNSRASYNLLIKNWINISKEDINLLGLK